jgi:hypothetical protein
MEEAASAFDMERFNLKKLNDTEIKERYQVEISNSFATSKKLGVEDVDISSLGKILKFES